MYVDKDFLVSFGESWIVDSCYFEAIFHIIFNHIGGICDLPQGKPT